jgi:hypothetical protein
MVSSITVTASKRLACCGNAQSHQTVPIAPGGLASLCRVAQAILENDIGQDWPVRRNKGSLTLQDPLDSRDVVTIFTDYGNRLALRAGRHLHNDPVVVAIAVCAQPASIADAIRDSLHARFRDNYLDPRNRDTEWHIMPNPHHFDMVFLSPGPCEVSDEALLAELVVAAEQLQEGGSVSLSELCHGAGWGEDGARSELADVRQAGAGASPPRARWDEAYAEMAASGDDVRVSDSGPGW